jgi:hypothetical protein
MIINNQFFATAGQTGMRKKVKNMQLLDLNIISELFKKKLMLLLEKQKVLLSD